MVIAIKTYRYYEISHFVNIFIPRKKIVQLLSPGKDSEITCFNKDILNVVSFCICTSVLILMLYRPHKQAVNPSVTPSVDAYFE